MPKTNADGLENGLNVHMSAWRSRFYLKLNFTFNLNLNLIILGC